MNYISKQLITVTAMIAVISACSSGNNRFKNVHFGDVIEYHKGETYSAKLLNEKFIDALNGNLGGNGFKKINIVTEGYDPGFYLNQNSIVSQFLNPDTQDKEPDPDPDFENYNLQIAQHGITSYSLLYNTPGVNYKTDAKDFKHKVSGLVLVPNLPIEQVKGIVLYYHGTEYVKNSIPSCVPSSDFSKASPSNFNYCNVNDDNFNKSYIAKLGASLAGQGYIVFAPDYIGLGEDYKSMHPYVIYPTINAITGIYGLQAVVQMLRKEKISSVSQQFKLFVGGYSEGGAYAMETSRIAQFDYENLALRNLLFNNHINLSATAPAEGAYSLSDVQMNFDFDDLKDGFLNKIDQNDHESNNLLDCSNLKEMSSDAREKTKCQGGTDYQKQNNPWKIGSSFMAAIAKSYIVSYAMAAYAHYSLHNLAAGYDQLMPREFWSDIPVTSSDKKTVKHLNLLQFFMDPSLKNSDLLFLIQHTGQQKYNGRNYNTSSDLYLDLYNFGYGLNERTGKDEWHDATKFDIIHSAHLMPESQFPYKIALEQQLKFGLASTGQNNSAGAFVHDKIRNLDLFKKSMQAGDTYRWNTQSPIYLIHGEYDSVVPSAHTDVAYDYMHKSSPNFIKRININNFQIANHDLDFMLDRLLLKNFLLAKPASDYYSPLPIDDYRINEDTASKTCDTGITAVCEKLNPTDKEKQKSCIKKYTDDYKELCVKFLSHISSTANMFVGLPMDHNQIEPVSIVGALCAFEQEGKQPNSICKPIK
jgi:hypothetical protein